MGPRSLKQAVAIERATRFMFTRIMSELTRTMRDEELTVAQIAALYTIDERGPMRINALAEWLGLSASTASRMCDVLTVRGLLSRIEDPDDRRARNHRFGRCAADRNRIRTSTAPITGISQMKMTCRNLTSSSKSSDLITSTVAYA